MELSIFKILSDQFADWHDDRCNGYLLKALKTSHIYIYGSINFLTSLLFFSAKNAHYDGIILDARTIALCPKLCWQIEVLEKQFRTEEMNQKVKQATGQNISRVAVLGASKIKKRNSLLDKKR